MSMDAELRRIREEAAGDFPSHDVECYDCGGSGGGLPPCQCPTCRGSGYLTEDYDECWEGER